MRGLLLLLLFGTWPIAPAGTRPMPPLATYVFGLSLATGHNGQLFSCFIVKEFEGRVIAADPITRDQFLLQARGISPSKANTEGNDLFTEFDIPQCAIHVDADGGAHMGDCSLLDDLWKLRFWEYPFLVKDAAHTGKGWSETPNAPSPRQMLLLSDLGLRYPTDICYGDNVFRLLHDVGDSAWVNNYRQGY